MNRLFFMIEGGKALELVKRHIADRLRTIEQARAIAADLGVDDIMTSRYDGKVAAVQFKDRPHPDFTKSGKSGSRPKKGTEWAARFAEQEGYQNDSDLIASEFNIPTSISYSNGQGVTGSRLIAVPFQECGFLFFGKDGPYAMWIPDVPGEVAADQARGYAVDDPARSFKPEFEGCRRIDVEEWDLLVAQRNLAKKRAEKQAA